MSDENRDSATGQFTSAEPLVGREGIEQAAGYVPYVDETAVTEESLAELTLEEAAERLTESHTAESDIRTYSPLDDLADNVTLTIEQAAKMTSEAKAADEAQAELDDADRIRAEVDELRKQSGVEPEAAKDTKPTAEKEEVSEPVKDGELDPDIEKAFNNPKIKDAITAHVNETETARQNHLAGLRAATQIAQAAFMSQFPEFASIPEAQRQQALQIMQQQDPGRYAQIESAVLRSGDLFRQQQIAEQRETEAQRTRIENHAREQNAIFEKEIQDVPKERRLEVEKEIATAIGETGADVGEVVKFLRTSEASNAAIMGLLWELGDTRLQLKAIKSAPKAIATRNVPPVMRPGVSSNNRSAGISSQIQSLEKQFDRATGDKQLRIAAQIHGLRERGRG